MSKEEVEGIILIISCQKHKDTRLKEFKLSRDYYNGWKVIYVLGDLTMSSLYEIKNNILTIQCEDSYIHLLKKVVMSIEILQNIYNIKQGILRCGDDLIFNEDHLMYFLNSPNKKDYIGYDAINLLSSIGNEYNLNRPITVCEDNFMITYYSQHIEDIKNPLHNLKGVIIGKYNKRPENVPYCSGVLFYISNKACSALITHMKKINYDVFYKDPETNSYPYSIEDCGVGFIMYKSKIRLSSYPMYQDEYNPNFIAYHTNKYR
jgi:hypothetical protein